MDEALVPFVVESVITSVLAFILLFFSFRQVLSDVVNEEPWRPLLASHYLTFVAVILTCVLHIDSAGGLGFYSIAGVKFIEDMKSLTTIPAASALATSFLDGYQKIVSVNLRKKASNTGRILFGMHATFMVFGLIMFISLAFSRNVWLAVAARSWVTIYSLFVGVQIVHSALRIRSVLLPETNPTGNYSAAINRLNRLIILVVVVVVIGNIGNIIYLMGDLESGRSTGTLTDLKPSFEVMHLLGDAISLVAPALLLMGGWKVSQKNANSRSSRKSGTPIHGPRRSTKTDSHGSPESDTEVEIETTPAQVEHSGDVV